MKRDFSAVLKHLNGSPLLAGGTESGWAAALEAFGHLNPEASMQLRALLAQEGAEPMTVAAVVADALVSPVAGDEKDTLSGKTKRMRLAMRVCDGGIVDVSADDIVLIKERVNKRRPDALIPVRVADHLEAEPQSAVVAGGTESEK